MSIFPCPRRVARTLGVLWLVLGASGVLAEYKGVRVCVKCHVEQGEAWRKTAHARAFDSLRPGAKEAAKRKAGLDPAKDYSGDENCIGCHVTGYGADGGYRRGMPDDDAKVLVGVACESCHGAGGAYRDKHGEALDRLKTTGATTDRRVLVESGQNFDYEKACKRCHESGPSASAAPHSPFTPAVDAKYAFDFDKSVRASGDRNPIHAHFKLRGVFSGAGAPAIRAELQATALEPEE